LKLIVEPEAEADAAAAVAWYEARSVDAAIAFLEAFREAAIRALEQPLSYEVRERGLRRVPLQRFPYGLYFLVADDSVVVVACFHARRDPVVLTGRVRG